MVVNLKRDECTLSVLLSAWHTIAFSKMMHFSKFITIIVILLGKD